MAGFGLSRPICLTLMACSLALGGASEPPDREVAIPRMSVVNDSEIFLASDGREAVLHVFCSPGPYGPTVPREYRRQAERDEDVLVLSLHGTWEQYVSTEVGALVQDPDAVAHLEIGIRVDGDRTGTTTWTLRPKRTSLDGYSLAIRGAEAARILERLLPAHSFVIMVPLEARVEVARFDLERFASAAQRALSCSR